MVQLTFHTEPAGFKLVLDGVSYDTPAVVTAAKGWNFQASGEPQMASDGMIYDLAGWNDSPVTQARDILTPEADGVYMVLFKGRTATPTATEGVTMPPTPTMIPTGTNIPVPEPTTTPATPTIPPTQEAKQQQEIIIGSIADTYVDSRAPTSTYGSSTKMFSDGAPAREVFLKFDARSAIGKVVSAKLRIYILDGAPQAGLTVHQTRDNVWSETETTYNSRPAMDASPLASFDGVANGQWLEVDVTSAIASGDLYSFGVRQLSDDGVYFAPREYRRTQQRPQLVIVTE